jgi:feruloyl esterase
VGPVSDFHAVVPAAEVAKARAALRLGAGHLPENTGTLMRSKTKLLIWHNSSDEKLTPWSSVQWYTRLAAKHGGYARVQQQARLFMLPGTGHCSITGVAPNSFDALGAMENWVERGQAPNALIANVAFRQFSPGAPAPDYMKAPKATMPLCAFPAMARYSGTGDVKDGANWSCPATDKRLLVLGESGKQAGLRK